MATLASTSMSLPARTETVVVKLLELASPDTKQDASSLHMQATSLVTRLRALNRQANASAFDRKQETADACQEVGQEDLALQNLLYEKRHLEREIQKCKQFASIYQDVPLYELDQFKQLAPPKAHEEGISEHQLTLNRLSFEFEERQRLSLQKAELVKRKEEVLKESKAHLAKMESAKSEISTLYKAGLEAQKKVVGIVASLTPTPATATTPVTEPSPLPAVAATPIPIETQTDVNMLD